MKDKTLKIISNFKVSNIIICLIVSMFISVLQMLGRFLDVRSQNLNVSFINIALEGLLFFVLCNIFLMLLWKLGQKMLFSKPFTSKITYKLWFWQLIIIISWLPCYLAYFPGIYSYDGEPQLIQYTSGQLDNHHPIIHTLILGKCYDLGKWLQSMNINIDGLAFYTTLQVLLLSFAFAYVLRFLVDKCAGKILVIASAIYICLFPTMPLMAISSTKDTFFAALFVLFITELAAIGTQRTDTINKLSILRLFIFSVGCMIFRRNGYYVVLILMICFAIVCISRYLMSQKTTPSNTNTGARLRKPLFAVTLALLISVAFFSITEKTIIHCTNALEGESAEALSIPLAQMARAFKSNDNPIRIKYGERLTTYISETGLCNYRPLITDGVKQYFNNEYFATNKTDFIKVYFELGRDYPGPYVLAVLYLTKGDWHILDTTFCEVYKDWWRDRTGYLITDATPVFAGDFVTKSNLLPALRDMYEGFATRCSFMNFLPFQVICAPASYVYLSVLGSIVLLMKKKKGLYPVMGAILLYLLTMFAGPCVLVRYIFPVMAAMPLFAWCVLNNND